MGRVQLSTRMCLLLMSTLLLMLSFTRAVGAAPQEKSTVVPEVSGTVTERNTYSPIADIGRLALGATGLFGQFWNTGTRLGGEFSRRAFDFLKVK
uniref:Secreted salivary basic peptide hyp6.2 n=1 Tax=Anopheles funestus TaxID=62324 RepID=A0A4Y0BG26_ANOFN